MNTPINFFGYNVVAQDDYDSGAVGVSINGVRMLNNQYETGRRLARAGAEGLPVQDIRRTDVEMLKDARQVIETDEIGVRYYLRGELRQPDRYLVPVKAKPVERTGQFGGSTKEKVWR